MVVIDLLELNFFAIGVLQVLFSLRNKTFKFWTILFFHGDCFRSKIWFWNIVELKILFCYFSIKFFDSVFVQDFEFGNGNQKLILEPRSARYWIAVYRYLS
jgi:hypothetical protein